MAVFCSAAIWSADDSDTERAGGGGGGARLSAAVPLSQVLSASRVAAIRGTTATANVSGERFATLECGRRQWSGSGAACTVDQLLTMPDIVCVFCVLTPGMLLAEDGGSTLMSQHSADSSAGSVCNICVIY